MPFFPQTDYHCGPAALATLLVYRGAETAPDQLAPLVYVPEKQGSFQLEIIAAARSYGFAPYRIKPALATILAELADDNPVLIMQNLGSAWFPSWHYAVVVGYNLDEQFFVLRSGQDERHEVRFTTLERTWQGANHWGLVITKPQRVPATAEPVTWLELLQTFVQKDQGENALAGYVAATRRWPDEPLVWFGQGNLQFAQQDFYSAKASFQKAIEINPESSAGWNNLAYTLAKLGCQSASQALQCADYHNHNQQVDIASSERDISYLLFQSRTADSEPDRNCRIPRLCSQGP